LAVKSSQATKEVSNLVKAIQTDTSRAIESMEQAIVEVVAGTQLAHNAGEALEKIETVSKSLSALIQSMSISAEEQAIVAAKISKMMEIIESIAGQTAVGTETTSDSISHLANLAEELRNSVSEFKLPEKMYGQ
jgi:twitching motility protein PilJ